MPGWYVYNGVGDPIIPASYVRASMSPSCTTGGEICAIYLVDNITIPTTAFSANRLQYISDGLLTSAPQPPTGTKFLFLRPGC